MVWHAKLRYYYIKLTHLLLYSAFLWPPGTPGVKVFCQLKWIFHTINLAQHKILARKMQFPPVNVRKFEIFICSCYKLKETKTVEAEYGNRCVNFMLSYHNLECQTNKNYGFTLLPTQKRFDFC